MTHDRDWALAAVAATVGPRLRPALIVYVVLVGLTRVLFGAHFPLDVVVGTFLGWQIGNFSVGFVSSAGLLPTGALVGGGRASGYACSASHRLCSSVK